jgi:hypothetical protein
MAHHSKPGVAPDRKGQKAASQTLTLPVLHETDQPRGSWLDARFYDKELACLRYEPVRTQHRIKEYYVRSPRDSHSIVSDYYGSASLGGRITRSRPLEY